MKRLSLIAGLAMAFALFAGQQRASAIECVDELQGADPSSTCCGLGSFDCDGNSANGCECRPSNSCHAVECAGSTCQEVMVPDDTYCADAAGCSGQGICKNGRCTCGQPGGGTWTPPADMGKGNGGHTPGGCDYTQTGTGAGLAVSVLALALFVAFGVRRRDGRRHS